MQFWLFDLSHEQMAEGPRERSGHQNCFLDAGRVTHHTGGMYSLLWVDWCCGYHCSCPGPDSGGPSGYGGVWRWKDTGLGTPGLETERSG